MNKSDLNSKIIEFISEQDRKNYEIMVRKVKEDYHYYNLAAYELKKDYRFINESIVSCLSEVNNMKRLSSAFKELRLFLGNINKYSESVYKATTIKNNDGTTLIVEYVGKPKMKVKSIFKRAV
ncbi:MAG: hypothetical protein PHN54_00290 [Bacilli bacterium]|nr:hypothetical protein [Bacilli bacterium]